MNGMKLPTRKQVAAKARRVLLYVVLITVFSLSWPFAGFAAEDNPVRVAVMGYPNYMQMDGDGNVSGYAYEYLQDIQKYTGWKYEFIEMNLADATAALENGSIDLIAGNQYTTERAKLYDYSNHDMGEGGSVLCVMPDDTSHSYNDYASYDDMKIAALAGSVRVEQTREKLARYDAYPKFVLYDTDDEAKAALESGKVDAVLMSIIRCESNYKILARLNTTSLYFCTSKQRPELKSQLDNAMESIHLESPYYDEELNDKYYGSIPVQLSFTQAERDYIESAEPITVALSDDLIPVEYFDGKSGDYRGIVPDSFKLIEEYSGLSFKFTSRKDMKTLKKQMDTGEVQLISSVANTKELAAAWDVELSEPYYDNSVTLVINDSVKDYKKGSCTVVLHTGYPYLKQMARELGYRNIKFVDTFKGCIAAVNSQKADLTLIPSDCADSIIHRNNYDNVGSYLVPDSYMDFCIGIDKSADSRLISILNKSIASISKEQRTELLVKNLAASNKTLSLSGFVESHRVEILIAALAVAGLIIAGVIWFAITRQRLNRRLQLALDKADAASRAKAEFLARMSHDMRTPMNGILGISYLMEENIHGEEQKKELLQLRESGEYLLQLINDVLDVNKAEIGQIELNPNPCDEERLFSSITSLMKYQIEKKNIEFNFENKGLQWSCLMMDERRVKQIFVNLLTNALKFTPEGGRIDFIMESVSEDEKTVRKKFTVRDTGIGINPEFIPVLFEPFSRENRAESKSEGTGLGLTIVKNLVELMGGTIDVKSTVNEGTEFTLYLEFPTATHSNDNKDEPVQDINMDALANIRILMCEDHPVNAHIAIRLLKKRGAEVIWKENGKEGLKAFEQSEVDFFDVILMDIQMPVMNGLEAAKAIRALERPDAGKVPVIAMTANAYDEDIKKSLDAGINEHLTKPVNPQVMYEVIARQVTGGDSDE